MITKIRKITKNDYVFSFIQKMINILTGVITISLISRYLGASLKGEYDYIVNIVNILNIFLGFGLYSSYSYSKRQKMERQVERYLNVFFLQALIYIVIGIVISIVVQSFIVSLTVALIVTRILNTHLQNIGVVEFIRYRQVLQIISYSIDLILTVLVYLFIPQNMYILLFILLIKYLFYVVAYLFKCKYIPKPFDIDKETLMFLFKFGFFAMLTALLSEFNYSIDVIIMGIYLPFSEIGLYTVGSKLAQYIWLIPDSFKEVLFSHTAKDDAIDEVKSVLRINIFITLVMIIIMAILGKLIIYILYGSEYLNSYLVTIVVFLGIPSMVVYKLITPLYNANGKQKKCFFILLISVLTNVVLNFLVIPMYGKMGAAVSTVISYTTCGVILFIDFIRTYNLSWSECLIIKRSDFEKLQKKIKKFIKG